MQAKSQVLLIIPIIAVTCGAQSDFSAVPGLSFDVTSVRRNVRPESRLRMQHGAGGTFSATAATLLALIREAYDVVDEQISGARGWMVSDRFDISAKVTETQRSFTREQGRQMLRTLLIQRFQLKVHTEQQMASTYALRVDNSGSKIKPWGGEEPTSVVARPPGTVLLKVLTTAALAKALTGFVGRLVVDETRLDGEYSITLAFTPEFGISKGFQVSGEQPNPPPASLDSISVFTAVRDQLGLTLTNRKGNVETIVIDDARKPSID